MHEANVFERPEAKLSTSRLIELLDTEREKVETTEARYQTEHERAENLLAISTNLARQLADMGKERDDAEDAAGMWQAVALDNKNRAEYAEESLRGFEIMAAASQGAA